MGELCGLYRAWLLATGQIVNALITYGDLVMAAIDFWLMACVLLLTRWLALIGSQDR